MYNLSQNKQVIMALSSQQIPDLIMTILTFRDWTIRRRRCQKLLIRFGKSLISLSLSFISLKMMKKKSQRPNKKMDKMYKQMMEKEKLRLKKENFKKMQKKRVP